MSKAIAILLAAMLSAVPTHTESIDPTNTEPSAYTVQGHFETSDSEYLMFIPDNESSHDYYMASADRFGNPIIGDRYLVTISAGNDRYCWHESCDQNGFCYYNDNEIIFTAHI